MNSRKVISIYIAAMVLFGVFAGTAAHAENPDYGNNCLSAHSISLSGSHWGWLGKKDRDYFKIVVAGPGMLTIRTYTVSAIDPEGALFDANCTELTSHKDIARRDSNFLIEYPVNPGEYYIRVQAENNGMQGQYLMGISFAGFPDSTITAGAGSGGSISPSGAVGVPYGGSQTFSITADPCYAVLDVIVDGESKGPQQSWAFTDVTSDHTIEAVFAPGGPYTITAAVTEGNGAISPSGAVSVTCGENKTFTFAPDADWSVLEYIVDGVQYTGQTSYTFENVGDNHTIEVRFKPDAAFTINTITGDNGSITPAGPTVVSAGGSHTVSIVPDSGYVVDAVDVNGNPQGTITSYTFTDVQSDQTIAATFKVDAGAPTGGCVDISDTPLDAQFRSAPPMVMFVLDDSGSMDWEVMTSEPHSLFGTEEISYIFDDPGDNHYSGGTGYGRTLTGDERKEWKAQFSGHNKMYYNPQLEYNPWPGLSDADTSEPRSDPMVASYTMKLADVYLMMTDRDTVELDDRDPEFSVRYSSRWDDAYYGMAYDSYHHYSFFGDQTKEAYWRPDLVPGQYEIWARWGDTSQASIGLANSNNVIFDVKDNGYAAEALPVDQTVDKFKWNEIFTSYFDDDSYVRISIDDDDAQVGSISVDAIRFVPVDPLATRINNAHYYTWHDANENHLLDAGETTYLVNFVDNDSDGRPETREWYEVNDDGDDRIHRTELQQVSESSVPTAVRPRLPGEDLQNFANWYSYYRRRMLSGIAAIAGVIDQASNMLIGVHGINGTLSEPLYKIDVDGVDQRDLLLDALYISHAGGGGTPLRRGFMHVGMYFDKTDSTTDTSGIHTLPSPYSSADDGGACQQAFAVLITDGYYNSSTPLSSPQNYDGDNGAPYADSWQDTLADIAMYYYETDLVDDADLADLVPPNAFDPATHQHMVTYAVGFGTAGTLNPDDYDDDLKHKTTGQSIDWPCPNPEEQPGYDPLHPDPDADRKKIDDMWHASVNGRGRFLTSSDPNELINDMLMILKDIEFFAGSASAVSVNGDELYTKINTNVRLFQSKYYSETWHGDLLTYKVNQITGEVITPAVWSAAYQLSQKSAGDRLIAFMNDRGQPKEFTWQKVNANPAKMWRELDDDESMAEKIFNYIRGDASDEETDLGGIFRSRKWRINDPNHPLSGQTITSSKLGDLVHSSPVYNRGALYTGANDGMLHCFDAETGDEIFAYIPYPVFRNLKHLTDPGYDHKYYVDLTPTVANVDIDGMTHMLVGGLGKGGKGYYALDISNVDPTQNLIPNSEANVKSMVKWEFPNNQNGAKKTSNADRADLGYTFSKVTVAKSHDTANAPWVVIFGNGYLSENEKAVLFILDPRDGTVIRKIDTGIAGCNGMSTPMAVDVDYDGIVDYVYAGDLRGNMWKFDLTDSDYNNWDVAFYESGAPEPLFSTPGQPITTRPDIMKHCSKPGYLVFFGTGQYLEEDDLSDSSQQSLYAIWDYGDDADDTETAGVWDGSTLTTTDLLTGVTLEPQTITEHVFENKSYRVTSATIPDYSLARLASGGSGCGDYPGETTCDMDGTPSDPDPVADPLKRVGWVMNLPGSGERIVSDVVVRGGNLIVVSYIPEGSLCGTGGASWLMQLNACTGARLGSVLYDRDDDGDIDADDRITPSGGGDKVVPSGISFDGRLQPPAIIILDDGNEMLYLSSSNGTIQTQRQKSTPLGLVWWRIFEPNQ